MYNGSVIDLVMMIDTNNLDIIKKLEVIPRTESDHLPVSLHVLWKGDKFSRFGGIEPEGEKLIEKK